MPRWLSHSSLLVVETVLVVGLLMETLEWLVLELLPIDPLFRVLLGMVVVASTLGGLLFVLQRRVRKAVDTAHKAFRRRYRLPFLGLHVILLVGIFLAYAAFWNRETGALDVLQSTFARWTEEWTNR